jgi:hypothetical protein
VLLAVAVGDVMILSSLPGVTRVGDPGPRREEEAPRLAGSFVAGETRLWTSACPQRIISRAKSFAS